MEEKTVPSATATQPQRSANIKEITQRLASDAGPLVARLRSVPDRARPLVERVRPKFDVFLPLVDEMRPLLDDLRPLARDLWALLGALLLLVRSAAVGVTRRADVGARRSGLMLAAALARRLPRLMPTVRIPSSLHRLGGGLRSTASRLRPGRWAVRAAAIAVLGLAGAHPTTRDAIVQQLDSARSIALTVERPVLDLPALQMPVIELPAIELPAIELPKVEIPAFELPAIELPKIDLSGLQFPGAQSAAPATLAPATFELPPLNAYRAAFETQAPYPTVSPNGTVEWVVALRNTGSVGWYRGVAGAQASLALTDGTEVAVQSTPYVAPGQVGWFVVRFRAPAGPGTQTVPLFPRIDGRGKLPDLGLFTLVTVR